jgi:hypothetical protein
LSGGVAIEIEKSRNKPGYRAAHERNSALEPDRKYVGSLALQ